MNLSTLFAGTLAMLALLTSSAAFAQEGPCGKFDFSDGNFDCRFEVEASCTAQCQVDSFKAGCTGGCDIPPTPGCVDNCGTTCIQECNPALLDCFQGCHDECDLDVQAACEASHPGTDCVAQAKAQCDMHCEQSCEVPPSDCKEHCDSCCAGGCRSLENFECDFDCFAELDASCSLRCDEPSGAIFCNGQYVNADDLQECVSWLAMQGITVEASAKASCGADGCDLDGVVDGCFCNAPGGNNSGGEAEGLLGAMFFGLVFAARRRRRSRDIG